MGPQQKQALRFAGCLERAPSLWKEAAAPDCWGRDQGAEASQDVLDDDARVSVQQQCLQLSVHPGRHLGPLQGC